MFTVSIAIATGLAGLIIGFLLGLRFQKVDPAQFRKVPRRSSSSRPAAEVAKVSTVTFPGAYIGTVYVLLARSEGMLPLTDVDVEIVWGPHTGTITLEALGTNPVAVVFEKGDDGPDAPDSVVTVTTSVPTARVAGRGVIPEKNVTVRKDLTWK